MVAVSNDDARHAGGRGALRVGIRPVADDEHFGRIELPPSTGCQWWHSLAGWLSRPGCAARSAPEGPGQDQTVEFLKEMNS